MINTLAPTSKIIGVVTPMVLRNTEVVIALILIKLVKAIVEIVIT